MLNSINLNDKSYEELLAEAIAQIPLYSKEWTNFNVSDPGVTILQNLTAFQMLQQEAINTVSDEVKRKLLKLVGYTARETQAACILVQAPAEGGPILPVCHQLWSGSVPFETTETVQLQPWGLEAVYVQSEDSFRDITRLLDDGTESFAYPFGSKPKSNDAFVCVLSGTPEMGEPIHLWLDVAEEELRTPFDDETEIPAFSRVRWQYYTKNGWKDAQFEDETIGLLRSGAVTLRIEEELPEEFTKTKVTGCALRCILEKADYDRVPRLKSIAVHLFPMMQKETTVQCIVCPGGERAALRGRLPLIGNIQVFCKEETDGPYYSYQRYPENGRHGRFYRMEETSWGCYLYFNAEFGKTPCDSEDAVRVVCYDEEMVHHRLLGPVYGYDKQTIKLDLVENILPDDFLLMLEKKTRDGDAECWFVAPGESGPDGFLYHIHSKEGEVVIDEPGYSGSNLQLVHCASTKGSRGNLRAGSVLEQRGGYDGTEVEARFACPAPGRGGMSYESFEELRRRFSSGMQETTVAARTKDFETLVRRTPGLCIHKVKAVADSEKNLVKIAVKPHIEEEFPKLSDEYVQKIREYLEPRRLLTTGIEICQPQYAPIGISAVISIRGMAAYARRETEELLRSLLDYVNGSKNFGDGIRFNEVYQKLNALSCVEAVDALDIFPESRDAILVGSDICVGDDCLCYPGTVRVDIREYGK